MTSSVVVWREIHVPKIKIETNKATISLEAKGKKSTGPSSINKQDVFQKHNETNR